MCLQLICLRGCRVTLHLFVFSRLCIFKCVLNKPALKRGTCSHIGCTCLTISYFVFRMCLWIACLWGFKVTLVLSLLCTVGLQMYLYMFFFFSLCVSNVSSKHLPVTLVAFLWLFSNVCWLLKLPACEDAKWLWLHFFPPVHVFKCVIKCLLKLSACEDAKTHCLNCLTFLHCEISEHLQPYWLHLFDFSQLCVFKSLPKLPVSEDAKSHWLHLFYLSSVCC